MTAVKTVSKKAIPKEFVAELLADYRPTVPSDEGLGAGRNGHNLSRFPQRQLFPLSRCWQIATFPSSER